MATVGWTKGIPAQGDDPRLAAFLAAGGDTADLCGTAGGGRVHDHERCGLCPVGLSAGLPPALATLRPFRHQADYPAPILSADLSDTPARYPAWSGRAPPRA